MFLRIEPLKIYYYHGVEFKNRGMAITQAFGEWHCSFHFEATLPLTKRPVSPFIAVIQAKGCSVALAYFDIILSSYFICPKCYRHNIFRLLFLRVGNQPPPHEAQVTQSEFDIYSAVSLNILLDKQ